MKKVIEAFRDGVRITPPYLFYIDVDPSGVITPKNCDLLTNGSGIFSFCGLVATEKMVFERCISVRSMFNAASTLSGKLDISIPAATDITYLCAWAGLSEIKASAPVATSSLSSFGDCLNLERLDIYMPMLKSADSFAANNRRLKYVSTQYPSLQNSPGMFRNCALEAQTINAILTSLQNVENMPGSHIITFTGCPGAATCSHEIATAKGWTVEL